MLVTNVFTTLLCAFYSTYVLFLHIEVLLYIFAFNK